MRIVLGLAMVITVISGAPPPDDIEPAVRTVLMKHWRFTTDDLADLRRGKAIKHSVDSSGSGEIAVAGGIRVNVPKQAFLDLVRDIATFKRSPDVLAIGRFSSPPTLQDLAPLTIDRDDFDPATCRVHDCGVRLPASVIERIPRESDPAAFFKRVLLENVIAYEKGDAQGRLLQYDDGEKPIRPADEFAALLQSAPALGVLAPSLPQHFLNYPADQPAGDDDFLYWSKEKFGIEPFVTVTHVTIVCPSPRTCVMATRDLYSSRYIDASLSISVATDTVGPPAGFYLFFANRSRANALRGAFAGLRRTIAARRARSSIEENLKRVKTRLETGTGAPPPDELF